MSKGERSVLIATNNSGKLREYRSLFAELPIEVAGLDRFPDTVEIEEVGTTFAENAKLKACGYAQQTGIATLADDSGLEIAALGGRPGVLSARYGGANTPFAEKMRMLLNELSATSGRDRRAQFVAAIAVANADGVLVQTTTAICRGWIASAARGSGGFGYDPLFIPDGYDETFGELPDNIKQNISHRARAFSQIMPFLRGFFAI